MVYEIAGCLQFETDYFLSLVSLFLTAELWRMPRFFLCRQGFLAVLATRLAYWFLGDSIAYIPKNMEKLP